MRTIQCEKQTKRRKELEEKKSIQIAGQKYEINQNLMPSRRHEKIHGLETGT